MEKKTNLNIMAKFVSLLICITAFALPYAHAIDLNQEPTAEEKATFDKVLEPVMKIYSLVKYAASAIAALVLLFAGISYMVSGNDPRKRDNSKSMAMYVIVGLAVIWATPLVVNYVL